MDGIWCHLCTSLCHSREGGNLENYSHSEFISGSTKKDAQNLFSMTIKSLDSRLRALLHGYQNRHGEAPFGAVAIQLNIFLY
ncbi:hypothetical protein [Rickettsia endosymbiont of Orchestes rusci]|uniref:hypothetical protein n=1 Tax=Rickettsia endosymbiont of Orchestes rusci TaxID=3066250 RepID=UPI00313E4267